MFTAHDFEAGCTVYAEVGRRMRILVLFFPTTPQYFLPCGFPPASALNTGISRLPWTSPSCLTPVLLPLNGNPQMDGRTCLMFKGRVIFFIAEQIGPRHQGVTEGCVGQKGAMGYGVQHHPGISERL